MDAAQTISRVGDAVQSEAHAELLGLDVLGGLVTVDGFVSDAVAKANGKAGGASGTYNPVIAKASVGKGLLGVQLDASGLGLTGSGLPADVQGQVNTVLGQVQSALNTVLNTIGVHITPVAGTSTATPDGKSATATGGSMLISLTPPQLPGVADGTTPLAQINLGAPTAAVNAAQQAPRTPVEKRPPTLAYTGANLPLAGAAGLGLLVLAGLLRRRFTS